MAAYRKSNKKNTRRKKTQLKKGHKLTSTLKESYTDNSSTSSVSVLQRPSSEEFADALTAQSTSKCDVDVLPRKLRPVKIEDENENDCEISEESEENIIINLNKLSELISAFFSHECLSASPSVKVVKRLGITVEVFCRKCRFISDAVDLFTTVPSSWGPDADSLNVCLLIPVLKSKVGICDVVQVLSCLNIVSRQERITKKV
jgi:hypothetical protein